MSQKGRRRRGSDQEHRGAAREQGNGSTVDLDALARLLAPRVALALAAMLCGAAQPSTYTTRREGPRPPEFASRHRAWLATAPMIPGATRLGRWWSVSREAYDRWLAGHASATEPAPAPAVADAKWSPAQLAQDLGLKLVGVRR
jgi:hypothetical protein